MLAIRIPIEVCALGLPHLGADQDLHGMTLGMAMGLRQVMPHVGHVPCVVDNLGNPQVRPPWVQLGPWGRVGQGTTRTAMQS